MMLYLSHNAGGLEHRFDWLFKLVLKTIHVEEVPAFLLKLMVVIIDRFDCAAMLNRMLFDPLYWY